MTRTTRIEHAVLHLLCFATSTYDSVPDYPGRNGVGGLFSQLNYLAQEVLDQLYQGRAPARTWHATTRLHGYGNGRLSEYFQAVPCPSQPALSTGEATSLVSRAPRHQVVSHLLHALYTPLDEHVRTMTPREFDVAMHVRRGDRMNITRQAERILIWDEAALLREAARYLGGDDHVGGAAGGGGTTTRARGAGTVLVASDDDAFSRGLARALEGAGHTVVRHGNEHQAFDAQNQSVEAALVCTAACVPPLLSLVQQFARARTLMLSTKSNLESFLLSWWFAANTARGRSGSAPGGGTEATATAAGGDDDPMPRLVDLDHAVTSTNTFSKQGRYFCSLPWGSRRGLCKGNQTSCELAAFAQRSFCAPAGAKADAKAGGGKGRGAKGKGGGGGGGGKATGRRW